MLLLCLFLFSSNGFSQKEIPVNQEIKFGLGAAFLGSGDFWIGKFEAEYIRNFGNYLSGGISLNFGHFNQHDIFGNWDYQDITTTIHLDNNVFITPFGKDILWDLTIGTGISLMYITETGGASYFKNPDSFPIFGNETRTSAGMNIILEAGIKIFKRNTIGVKGIIQPYLNGDISSGLGVKFGWLI